MPSISVDYAIMEKSDKIALVELLSDWNDLGSWQSIYNVKEKDKDGNVLTGKVVVDNVKNSFIYSQKEIVAVSGLEDIILVETEDAIMACKMDESQNVKKLYEKLKAAESDTTKLHKTVFRPWGYYTCMNSGKGYLTKTICVMPKQKLSIQSHEHRSEHWVVLEGRALVLLNGKEYNVDAGESIDIPLKSKHSLQNPYDEELKIIEVQKGDYISEDDIIRYEDCYGRV
jgi:mannose-1-phosphate guanylyltransferase/mannose-6-phosphate isomerase